MTSEAPTENDLWAQLRASMDRLASMSSNKSTPEVLAKKLADRASQLRGRITSGQAIKVPLVVLAFNRGKQRYGIPVTYVLKVHALQQFTPVPGTPKFVSGVIHWRGDVLSLLDLGKLFEISESGIADVHICLILEAAGRRVSVVAHDVEEILVIDENSLTPAPNLPGCMSPDWILGVHDDNRLILNMSSILQDEKLVDWR